ncbi:MAG TPA: Tn3 family transposase [Steroidobacteraceae bacterium]|nr:Tn3 family transposase [Steroidobacteraceae bacterium]
MKPGGFGPPLSLRQDRRYCIPPRLGQPYRAVQPLHRSDLRPTRLHSDSHGQSAHVFALAYLLGIELMPRISWRLIEEHYRDFMRLDLAIHSAVLRLMAMALRPCRPSGRSRYCAGVV